jgi:hypothetical protein
MSRATTESSSSHQLTSGAGGGARPRGRQSNQRFFTGVSLPAQHRVSLPFGVQELGKVVKVRIPDGCCDGFLNRQLRLGKP